jgi:hypothetical protein
MEQNVIFDYKPSRNLRVKTLVFSPLVIFPACLFSLITLIPLTGLAEHVFSTSLPNATLYVIFFAFIILLIINSLRKNLRKLIITTETITWETSLRKVYSLKKEEITKISWKNRKLILNEKAKIHLSSLPKKDRILLNISLFNWIPDNVLGFDILHFRQFKDEELPNIEFDKQSISAETDKRNQLIVRGIATITLILLILGLASNNLNRERIGVFLFLSSIIVLIFTVIWVATTHRTIRITDEGIIYRRGKKVRTYNWSDIEVIGAEIQFQQFLIWSYGRQKKLSYSRMNADDLNKVATIMFQQASLKDIPFGVV